MRNSPKQSGVVMETKTAVLEELVVIVKSAWKARGSAQYIPASGSMSLRLKNVRGTMFDISITEGETKIWFPHGKNYDVFYITNEKKGTLDGYQFTLRFDRSGKRFHGVALTGVRKLNSDERPRSPHANATLMSIPGRYL